jgi:hypothetical protein
MPRGTTENAKSESDNDTGEEGVETGHFGSEESDENCTDREEALPQESGNPPDRPGVSLRVKTLYRKIVRLLHPDAAGKLSQRELELWYKTQDAYGQKDLFALETILARCDRVGTNQLSISELHSLIREAKSRLEILRRSIVVYSERPGWGFRFLSQTERKKLLRPLRSEMEIEIHVLSREVRSLETRLERARRLANSWYAQRQQDTEQSLLRL